MDIRCFICNLQFETPSILNDHQRYVHTVEELSAALLAIQGHRVDISSDDRNVDISADDGNVEMFSDDSIIDISADDGVVEISADDGIVEISSDDGIVDISSDDGIVEISAEDGIVEFPPDDGILEISSDDDDNIVATSSSIIIQNTTYAALANKQGFLLLSQVETKRFSGNIIRTSLHKTTPKSAGNQRYVHAVEELSVALLAIQGHQISEVETETFNDIIIGTSSNDNIVGISSDDSIVDISADDRIVEISADDGIVEMSSDDSIVETSSSNMRQNTIFAAFQNEQGYLTLSQIETENSAGNIIGTSLYNTTQKSPGNQARDVHHRENCNICTKTYSDLCRQGSIACKKCLRVFISRSELFRHDCLLKDYIFSVCPECKTEFLTLGACTEHFYLAHPNSHKPDTFNRCTYCDQIFLGGLTFHIHLENHVYNG